VKFTVNAIFLQTSVKLLTQEPEAKALLLLEVMTDVVEETTDAVEVTDAVVITVVVVRTVVADKIVAAVRIVAAAVLKERNN
jgi:hypothetical protein